MNKLYNERILKAFMLIQPIIDAITSIMINEYSFTLSLGMVLRFLFLIYVLGYIFLNKNKKIIIYCILWFLYIAINIIGNYILKDNFNIFVHLTLLIKMIYFPMVLLFWLLYFKKNKTLDNKVFIYIAILVGFSLVVSCLSKTAYCTYSAYDDCYQKGIVAWFNSANEYGLILIALLGFCLYEFMNRTNIINIVALILTVIFLCILGTKASYIGVVLVISSFVIYYFIKLFFNRYEFIKINRILFLVISLFIIVLFTSKLPIYTNLVANYERAYEEATNINNYEKYCFLDKSTLDNQDKITEEVKSTLIFNGRDDFIKINGSIYKDSPLFSKLFGMTTQGNYYEGVLYTHINERDFHDLYMYYGVIGFILELLLPISITIEILKKIISKIKIVFNDYVVAFGIVTGMILVGAFIAGHCLFSPAVSIYLSYLIAILYKKIMVIK